MPSPDQAVLPGPEADLARRDPALPMLPLVLDDAALSAWLSGRLGRPVRAHRTYLRHKPGTACVAAVRLLADGVPDQTVMVAHWAEGARAKMTKTCDRAAPEALLAVDEAARVVVGTPAADRDLPAMARLADPDHGGAVLRRVAGRTHPDQPDPPEVGSLTTLSYKPQRRWVGAVRGPDGRRVLLRAYRPAALPTHLRAARSLGDHDAALPQLLGHDAGLGLAAFAWVEGRQLDWHRDRSRAGELGTALATLHRHPPALPPEDACARGTGVLATAGSAAVLLPELAGRVRAVAHEASARLSARDAPGDPVTLHGDLSADQVVLGDHGARLIDLDRVRSGEAADDLGSLAATARLDGVEDVDRVLDAVLGSYVAAGGGRVDPADVRLFTAVQLLERCTDGFRLAHPDWVVRLHRAVTLAEELLS